MRSSVTLYTQVLKGNIEKNREYRIYSLHFLHIFRELETAAEVEVSQEQLVMQRLVPVIERQLSNINDHQRANYEQLVEMIKTINHQVSDISTGRAPLQISLNCPQGSSTPTVSTSAMPSSSEASSSLVAYQPSITVTAPTGSASTTVSSVPNVI